MGNRGHARRSTPLPRQRRLYMATCLIDFLVGSTWPAHTSLVFVHACVCVGQDSWRASTSWDSMMSSVSCRRPRRHTLRASQPTLQQLGHLWVDEGPSVPREPAIPTPLARGCRGGTGPCPATASRHPSAQSSKSNQLLDLRANFQEAQAAPHATRGFPNPHDSLERRASQDSLQDSLVVDKTEARTGIDASRKPDDATSLQDRIVRVMQRCVFHESSLASLSTESDQKAMTCRTTWQTDIQRSLAIMRRCMKPCLTTSKASRATSSSSRRPWRTKSTSGLQTSRRNLIGMINQHSNRSSTAPALQQQHDSPGRAFPPAVLEPPSSDQQGWTLEPAAREAQPHALDPPLVPNHGSTLGAQHFDLCPGLASPQERAEGLPRRTHPGQCRLRLASNKHTLHQCRVRHVLQPPFMAHMHSR